VRSDTDVNPRGTRPKFSNTWLDCAGRAAVTGGGHDRWTRTSRTQVVWHRQLAVSAAEQLGCRLVASGTLPYDTPGLAGLTDTPRYPQLARRFAPLVAEAGTCACHVHVGVPSRDLGAQVLALREELSRRDQGIVLSPPLPCGRS
jgi:Glutamate-cysteine ligase family 2(GCS2)